VPYKRQEDVRNWERAYRQKRERNDQREVADLEGEIIALVEKEPGKWDTFTLWRYHFQPRGYTFKTVQKAVDELRRGGALLVGRHCEGGMGLHWLSVSGAWEASMAGWAAITS
jgi:hypothetical protein